MKVRIIFIMLVAIMLCCMGCKQNGMLELKEENKIHPEKIITSLQEDMPDSDQSEEDNIVNQMHEYYNMTIEQEEKSNYENECIKIQSAYYHIYNNVDKGIGANSIISQEAIKQIAECIASQGYPVISNEILINMMNYNKVEEFIVNLQQEKEGIVNIYEVHSDGGLGRLEFKTDGREVILTTIVTSWTTENEPFITYMDRCKLRKWEYTKKGWFVYEKCVPEPPEVSELVNGNAMIRVQPIPEEYINLCQKYIAPIGYIGNNVFLTNWSNDSYGDVDFNDLYEYLFQMETGELYLGSGELEGIPRMQFEKLVKKYFSISEEQLRTIATYNTTDELYPWVRLGCGNYAPDMWGTPIPEVIGVIDNPDDTITLLVDAVWQGRGIDHSFSHEVTMRVKENGEVQYLGNKIIDEENSMLPQYSHRTK